MVRTRSGRRTQPMWGKNQRSRRNNIAGGRFKYNRYRNASSVPWNDINWKERWGATLKPYASPFQRAWRKHKKTGFKNKINRRVTARKTLATVHGKKLGVDAIRNIMQYVL